MKVTDVATREELQRFQKKSNFWGAYYTLFNWAFIAAIFAAVGQWTHPLSVLLGVVLLGGRQLAFAALYHDAGHGLLFENKWLNHHVGQLLCAYPVLSDMPSYAKGHRRHHGLAGTKRDPDLPNYAAYPVTPDSFRRKVLRDLTGRTGLKAVVAVWRRSKSAVFKAPWNGNFLLSQVIVNGALFGALHAAGHGTLYLMWPAAYLTFHMLFARLRQIAEHGAVPDLYDLDPRRNTRTTYVAPWEKLFVAPFNLNYHLEHHYSATVPCYRLKGFHRFLKERGLYEGVDFPSSYRDLFTRLVLRAPDEPASAATAA